MMKEEEKKRAVGTHTSENEIKFLCVAEAESHPLEPKPCHVEFIPATFANFFIHRHPSSPLLAICPVNVSFLCSFSFNVRHLM